MSSVCSPRSHLWCAGVAHRDAVAMATNQIKPRHKRNTLPCAILSFISPLLVLFSGGAISNMYSVMIARYKFFPEVKTKGMAAAPRLVLFTSELVSPILSLFLIASWEHVQKPGHVWVFFLNPVCFVTDTLLFPQSHYSIKKSSAALGFGTENLILLKTDERFVFNLQRTLKQHDVFRWPVASSFPEGESSLLIWRPK